MCSGLVSEKDSRSYVKLMHENFHPTIAGKSEVVPRDRSTRMLSAKHLIVISIHSSTMVVSLKQTHMDELIAVLRPS